MLHNHEAGTFCNWRPLGTAEGQGLGKSQPLPAPDKRRIKACSAALLNITIALVYLCLLDLHMFVFFFLLFQTVDCNSIFLVPSHGVYVPPSSHDIHDETYHSQQSK